MQYHEIAFRTVLAAVVAGASPIPAAAQEQAPAQQPAGAQAAQASETRYTLVEVGGKALPVVVEKEWRCREELTAGTLTLRNDGRWLLQTSKREICGDRTEEERDNDDGLYKVDGQTIAFFDDDGRENTDGGRDNDIDLDELKSGTLADDGPLSVRLADGRTTLVFRRAS